MFVVNLPSFKPGELESRELQELLAMAIESGPTRG
jgi:hypothetical protein